MNNKHEIVYNAHMQSTVWPIPRVEWLDEVTTPILPRRF